jgi:hypothetical protein
VRPVAAVNASLRAFDDRVSAGDLDELYEIVLDGESFILPSAYGGSARPPTDPPDLRLELPAWVLIDLRLGTLRFEDAVARKLITKRGSAAALQLPPNFQTRLTGEGRSSGPIA